MEQEDLIEKDLTLSVLLPEGHEKTVTVHGSKPVMDVLVILCARYHLNPSDHVIELFSMNHNKLKFKPSSLIGSLEAELVVLKPKRSDIRKAPNMPVATVRLLINYRKSHKAVVRVSPRVPLAELMPTVCEKCEMDPKNTVLLRDSQSEEPLDLTKTLNDYGIRDVYAKAVSGSPNDPAALTQKDCKKEKLLTQEKVLGEKENRGLLGLFRRSKKSAEETPTNTDPISATASLVLKDQHAINTHCSETNSASEMPKKRRAPQPPSMLGSQSVSAEPNSGRQAALPSTHNEKEGVLSRVSSTESSLKQNKRRAPPPPCTSPSLANKEKEVHKDKVMCSFSSERLSILENDEEDDSAEAVFKQSSHFKPNRSSIRWSPLMTEVVSELTDRIKSMEQKDASFDWSVIPSHPAPNLPPVSGSVVDADPALPPGCELPRNGSRRDGVNTFTVVPQKRPQSTRQYEFLLTMKNATVNGDAGEHLEERVSESRETEKMETSSKETVMLEKTDDEFENVVETNQEPGITEGFGKLHLNIDVEEHLAEENLTKEHLTREHLTKKHLAEEHLTKEHLPEEHLAKEHLIEEQQLKEHLAEKHLAEEKLAKEHLTREHLAKEHLTREHLTKKHLAKEYLAEKHLPEEHLTKEHLAEKHLPEEHLPKEHLEKEHLAEKHLPEEHLAKEHLAKEHLAEKHLLEEHLTKKHLAKENLIEEQLTKEHLIEEQLTKEHLIEEQLTKEHLARAPLTKKHLAKEHLAEKQLAEEHLSEKHLAKEHPQDEHSAKEHLIEEQLAKKHLQDEHPAEKHLSEDRDGMEDQDERDWIKEYAKRRRIFLSDYDYGRETKLKTSRKAFYEEMLDDVPPHPSQLSVCWEEEEEEEPETPEETEGLGTEETEEDESKANPFTLQNPNPSTSEEPYFDVNLSSNLHSSNSTPFTSSSQSNPQDHQPTSLWSALPHGSKSKLEPSFKRSSPNSPSLFSLAVSQRVQSLGNAFSPSIPSTRTISSPTPHPQRVGSQHTSSQKLYFQSLISEEIVSKFPGSLDPCGEAPPTSTAPPTVIITTQARRQAWSSFSRTQLKNLEQV
ncbi:cordon-bleu protein-like 1 isoform X1 [Hemibagrus wyckioides]|uniref:cordon-bleu protein-like 1 isoform X1 n=1 Tax=Hemibagrus wyckioides TaxID=337641 RepID=UPI00266CC221|nr:cordon-bleu protein-like 1 isoform X1 [Hemibagrus wyckioides]